MQLETIEIFICCPRSKVDFGALKNFFIESRFLGKNLGDEWKRAQQDFSIYSRFYELQ